MLQTSLFDFMEVEQADLFDTGLSKKTVHCSRCKNYLPPEKFWKSKSTKTGFRFYCIACCKEERNIRALSPEFKAKAVQRTQEWYKTLRGRYARENQWFTRARLKHDIDFEWWKRLNEIMTHCPITGIEFDLIYSPNSSHSRELDHITPLARGGKHCRSNVWYVSRKVNLERPRDGSDASKLLKIRDELFKKHDFWY